MAYHNNSVFLPYATSPLKVSNGWRGSLVSSHPGWVGKPPVQRKCAPEVMHGQREAWRGLVTPHSCLRTIYTQNDSNVLPNHSGTRRKIPLPPPTEGVNGNIWWTAPTTSRVLLSSCPNSTPPPSYTQTALPTPRFPEKWPDAHPIPMPTRSPGIPEDRHQPLRELSARPHVPGAEPGAVLNLKPQTAFTHTYGFGGVVHNSVSYI